MPRITIKVRRDANPEYKDLDLPKKDYIWARLNIQSEEIATFEEIGTSRIEITMWDDTTLVVAEKFDLFEERLQELEKVDWGGEEEPEEKEIKESKNT